MMYIYPYKMGSKSAKALAKGLRIKLIKREGSKFKATKNKTVINWGNSVLPDGMENAVVINNPNAVEICSNKLKFLRHIEAYNMEADDYIVTPWFTTDAVQAGAKIADGAIVVCRQTLNGHSGEGIVIATEVGELVRAPLYTEYLPKKSEYRVHVLNGAVVDVQRKARDKNIPDEDVNWKVRNHKNGFIFVREGVMNDLPDCVLTQSLAAVRAVGLDFGAVDIIWNDKKQFACVLEINTAPGLEGKTLDGYIERFNATYQNNKERIFMDDL